MRNLQAAPIPDSHKMLFPQLIRDFRTALSYVSFYSLESPFVQQAVQKLHKGLLRLLMGVGTVVIRAQGGSLFLNDTDFSECDELRKDLEDKEIPGLVLDRGLSQGELIRWIKHLTLPVSRLEDEPDQGGPTNLRALLLEETVLIQAAEAEPVRSEAPTGTDLDKLMEPAPPVTSGTEHLPGEAVYAGGNTAPLQASMSIPVNEALLSFIAEAWQHAQTQRKMVDTSVEMTTLAQSFEKLFDRLLDRVEKTSPEFAGICQWFKADPGEFLEKQTVSAMYPLLETAVRNSWTAVLFDPATEGLVGECLAQWGAQGKNELVEKTVIGLTEGFAGDPLERELALTHLMDARPWISNSALLEIALERLNALLANESFPGLYQSALLLAWDLTEPALANGNETAVLTLLSTLHFHADEDLTSFPERSRIARHWLFERSTPEMIRRFVRCAHRAGKLNHYPLLGDMAAKILISDYFAASPSEKAGFLPLFSEMRDSITNALAETLPDLKEEEEVRALIPIVRASGLDAALSFQFCPWLGKGSRELKQDLISMIEEVKEPGGGPALRLALFDDSEEIAAMAARVTGKIGFKPALPVLVKAAKIRESHFPNNDLFLASVCQALGDLGGPEAMPILQDIARKKPLLRGRTCALSVRLAAIQALTRLNKPEAWQFVESLMEEKNPQLQEGLEKILQDKTDYSA